MNRILPITSFPLINLSDARAPYEAWEAFAAVWPQFAGCSAPLPVHSGELEALTLTRWVTRAHKNNFALLSNLGTIQRQQGKTDEALVSYTAALSLQPKNKLILSNRAELYIEMGETEKALSDYQALLLQIGRAHV